MQLNATIIKIQLNLKFAFINFEYSKGINLFWRHMYLCIQNKSHSSSGISALGRIIQDLWNGHLATDNCQWGNCIRCYSAWFVFAKIRVGIKSSKVKLMAGRKSQAGYTYWRFDGGGSWTTAATQAHRAPRSRSNLGVLVAPQQRAGWIRIKARTILRRTFCAPTCFVSRILEHCDKALLMASLGCAGSSEGSSWGSHLFATCREARTQRSVDLYEDFEVTAAEDPSSCVCLDAMQWLQFVSWNCSRGSS